MDLYSSTLKCVADSYSIHLVLILYWAASLKFGNSHKSEISEALKTILFKLVS